jgi:uncharacterized protein (UPF0332 family)
MTIKIYNENRLTRQPFFKDLIQYLDSHEDVGLREIHRVFENVKNIDRQLDSFISAGFIWRENKRYGNNFPVFEDTDFDLDIDIENAEPINFQFEETFFVRAESRLNQLLDQSVTYQTLKNSTNAL